MTHEQTARLRRYITIFLKSLPFAWAIHLGHVAFVLVNNLVPKDQVAYVLIANAVISLFHLPIYYRFLKADVGGTLVGCYVKLATESEYSDCVGCLVVSTLVVYFHFILLLVFQVT